MNVEAIAKRGGTSVPGPLEAGFEKGHRLEYTPDDTSCRMEGRSHCPEGNLWLQSDIDAGARPAEFPVNNPHKYFGTGQSHVCCGCWAVRSSRLHERERERTQLTG